MMDLRAILASCPLVPVVVIQNPDDAVPLAHALLAGGIKTIEITLRSEAALAAIQNVARDVPDIIVGAGTVTHPAHIAQAMNAGAQFLVSPGLTPGLAEEARKQNATLLPGAATASEIMQAQEWGFDTLKLFPAEQSGGPAALKHYAAVFPGVRFCPTGGVSINNLAEYLACKNVICVGGSWLTPADAVSAQHWEQVTHIAQNSLAKCTLRA